MKIADPNSGSQLCCVAEGRGRVNSPRDDVVHDYEAKTNLYIVPSWVHNTLLQNAVGDTPYRKEPVKYLNVNSKVLRKCSVDSIV